MACWVIFHLAAKADETRIAFCSLKLDFPQSLLLFHLPKSDAGLIPSDGYMSRAQLINSQSCLPYLDTSIQ